MTYLNRPLGFSWAVAAAAITIGLTLYGLTIQPAFAGTTGSISGTVTDASTQKPLADVRVAAVSPSGVAGAVTDSKGFYNIGNLIPDTYLVSFERPGFSPVSVTGVTVFADQAFTLNEPVTPAALRTIGAVRAHSAANLVQPGQTADVYNLSAQQFDAAQGADNLHKTLYQYLQSVPGVTILGAGGVPRTRGGNAVGMDYELDGTPINDRLTGLFTTNLSNLGVNSVELYTGGFNARYGHATAGVINNTIKTGTYPAFSVISTGLTGPTFNHYLTLEYGGATADRRFSYYLGFDGVNSANQVADGEYTWPFVAISASSSIAPDVWTRDLIGNFHYHPSSKDDLQFLVQNGYGRFDFGYLLASSSYTPMEVDPCNGVVVTNVGGIPKVTNGGTSSTGRPCVDPLNGTPTGLQYMPVGPNSADVWHHYSGIGKLQWTHTFGDKLYSTFKLAENFNQYIFNQPYDDPNFPVASPYKGFLLGNTLINRCPFGVVAGQPSGTAGRGCDAQSFYGDRRSNIYLGGLDLTFTPDATTEVYAGASYEYDQQLQAYYDREGNTASGGLGSPFNLNGTWPFLYLNVDYPLTLPTAYVGVKKTFGRLTVEPSIRYEGESYHIPLRPDTGGAYYISAWDPRFGLSWQVGPNDIVRASYATTTGFVPSSYFFNDSPNGTNAASSRVENPYAPGSYLYPELDNNYDFSYAHQFGDGRTSMRVTPYYHQARNTLTFYPNFTVSNGMVTFSGPNLLKTDGVNKNFGVELGLNHIEQGTNALSWFLSGTYENSWSSSQVLTTALTSFTSTSGFLLNHTLYHVAGNPPLSASLTADIKHNRWHVDPYVLYQCCAWYNVFGSDFPTSWPNGEIDTAPHQAPGWWWGQISFAYDLLRKDDHRRASLGLLVTNLFDNLRGPSPSKNNCYGRTFPIAATSTLAAFCPAPGWFSDGGVEQFPPGTIPNTGYGFTPDSQNVRTFELFLTIRN